MVVAAMTVSIDGVLLEPGEARISVFDRGLLYGDGCFEVLRTWSGVLRELELHLDRLYDTVLHLQLPTVPRDQLADSVQRTVAAAGSGEHRIRIVLTRGPGGLGVGFDELPTGHAIVIVEPLPPQPTELSLAVVDWPVGGGRGRGHKTLAYLDSVIARELARNAGADEAVRLDDRGFAVECATSNLFAVHAGRVMTPPIGQGVLPGIVRARVLELCAHEALASTVREIALAEIHSADELFVTSSLRGVVAVTRLDGMPRAAGPITARLAAAYTQRMCTSS